MRTLTLKKETLVELATAELVNVVGAAPRSRSSRSTSTATRRWRAAASDSGDEVEERGVLVEGGA